MKNILKFLTIAHLRWCCAALFLLAFVLSAPGQTMPASFTTNLTVNGTTVSVTFSNFPIRSPNFAVNVQQADGSWAPYNPGPSSTYLGTVAGYPGAIACGTLLTNGHLWAKIAWEPGNEWVYFSGPSARAYNRGGSASFGISYPSSSILTRQGGAGTTIYAAETAVDSSYSHYNECGRNLYVTTMAVEHSILSTTYFYMRDVGVKHTVGAVYIRANYDQDPYHSIGPAGSKMDYCRVFLNGIDPTHDVGLVADSIGGGVAWVGVIGTWVRYSANGYNGGENGDFSQVWRHEVGHNWNCGDWEGSSAEGSTIMNGNSFARCSGPEQNKIIGLRNGKLDIFDNHGPASFPIPPRASMDAVLTSYPNPTVIDVLYNDHSVRGLPISLLSFDATSSRGGTIVRSSTDTNQLVYTPPATSPLGADKFSYRISDSAGGTSLGYVYVMVDPPVNDLVGHWPLDEGSGTVAYDASGSANNGTVASANAWTSGMLGGTLEFDGTAMNVSIPSLNLVQNQLTITCWVRRKGSQVSYAGLVFSRGGNTVAGLDLRGISNQLGYHWNDGQYNWASGLTLPDNQWAFCAMVIEPTRAIFYMDDGSGLRAATNNTAHALQSFSGTTYIGYDPNAGRYFKGSIDDVHIFRKALSASEIAQIAIGSGTAFSPSPASGGSIFGGTPALQWRNPPQASSQHVYIGTDHGAVANATPGSPEYAGTLSGNQYLPTISGGTYYWRIDEVIGAVVIKGPIWFFSYSSGDPVARWKLDEQSGTVVRDAFGIYDGSYNGAPQFGQTGTLIESTNSAVRFNGTSQSVIVPYNAALNPASFTVEVWCKVTGGSGTWRSPLTSRDDAPTRGYNFYAGTDNKWQFWTGTGSTGWNSMTGPSVDTNQWVQLVGVVNGSYQSFYVNGALAASSQASFSPNTVKALRIGSGDGAIYYFPGLIDDVRLYNRALTGSEIASRYQQSVNQKPVLAGGPVVLPPAPVGVAYTNTLAGKVLDANPGDTIVFSKVSGPAWMTVSPDGTVSGTPAGADGGLNTFEARATDVSGSFTVVNVTVSVGGLLWSGGASNNNWNQGANWSGIAPVAGQDVSFAGLMRRSNTNNAVSSLGQISFLTPGFSLFGNGLTLTKGIVNLRGPSILAIGTTLQGAQTFSSSNDLLLVTGAINNNANTLNIAGNGNTTLSGVLSGAGGLTKADGGTLRLSNAANSFGGNIIFSNGTAVAETGTSSASTSVLGAKSASRTITVQDGASLQMPVNNIFGGSGMNASSLPSMIVSGTLSAGRFNVLPNITLNGGELTQGSTETSADYEGFQFIGNFNVGGTKPSRITGSTGKANHLKGAATTTFNVADATASTAADLIVSARLRDGSGDYPGAGVLAKTGPGTMLLEATNSYSGGTTVSQGTLAALISGDNHPLGSGQVNLAGGTLALVGPPTQQPLVLTGYNQDVIFGATEANPSAGSTRGIDTADYIFYETGAPGAASGGLPSSRSIVNKQDAAVVFELSPYAGNNALSLPSGSGTLTLASSMAFASMDVLHTSGSGTTTFNVILNFSDGSSTMFSGLSSGDWGVTNASVATLVKGRVKRNSTWEPASNWYLFANKVDLSAADEAKLVQSITFTKASGSGVLNIFAVSGRALNGPVTFDNNLQVSGDSGLELQGADIAALSGSLGLNGGMLRISGLATAVANLTGPASVSGISSLDVGIQNFSFDGGVSGTGNLTKLGAGNLTVSTGSLGSSARVQAGRLLLEPGVSFGGQELEISANAFVQAQAGLSFGAGQTLLGNGTFEGELSIGGKIAPGQSVGRLNVIGSVQLSGITEMDISRQAQTNDQLVASGNVVYGGELRVISVGATPIGAGDSFKLFSAPSYEGAFGSITPPTPGNGLAWDTSALLSSGVLKVIAKVNQNPTNIMAGFENGQLTLSWPPDYTGWTLQAQTNSLSTGLGGNWVDVPGSAGTNKVYLPVNPANPAVFYRLKL